MGGMYTQTLQRRMQADHVTFIQYLLQADEITALGGTLNNVDATLIAERPKILPHVPLMKERLAAALSLTPSQIGLKATTNETLGFLGRQEGMAALATACIEMPHPTTPPSS